MQRRRFPGNLRQARKYLAFSEKAAEEGFTNVATLFKAASEAETIHAKKLLKVLAMVGPTEKNLEASIAGETHEFTSMYPGFVRVAEDEKKTDAIIAFTHAMKAEQVHAALYKKALDAIKAGHDLGREKIFLCPGLRQYRIRESTRQVPDLRGFWQAVPGNHPVNLLLFLFSGSGFFFTALRSAPVQPDDHEQDSDQGRP